MAMAELSNAKLFIISVGPPREQTIFVLLRKWSVDYANERRFLFLNQRDRRNLRINEFR